MSEVMSVQCGLCNSCRRIEADAKRNPQAYTLELRTGDDSEPLHESITRHGPKLERIRTTFLGESVLLIGGELFEPVESGEVSFPLCDRDNDVKRETSETIATDDESGPSLADLGSTRRVEVNNPNLTPSRYTL